MTLKELMELRAQKSKAIGSIVEEKGDTIVAADLGTINTLKDEILSIDLQIEAIQAQRSTAMKNVQPAADEAADKAAEFKDNFVAHLKGTLSVKEYDKYVATMTSGTATSGAEVVPPEFLKTLIEAMKEYGSLIGDVTIIETANHGELTIPTTDDTGNTGVWTAEGGTITLVDFVTGKKTLLAHKVTTGVAISNELIEDSFFPIGSDVASKLGIRLARTYETAFVNGDGVNKPTGILTDAATAEIISAGIGAVTAADAKALIAAVPPSSRKGAKFYASDAFMIWMSEQVDTTGRPLYQANAQATEADEIKYAIGGYSVVPNYELGDIVAGDNPLMFGNTKAHYTVRLVRSTKIQRSEQLLLLSDETVFIATARLDGKPTAEDVVFSKLTVRTV